MRLARLTLVVALATLVAIPPAGALGRDPGLAQQWGIRQIGAQAAWERGVLGGGSTVAVIDTGIEATHEDLQGQVAATITCIGTRGDPRRCAAGTGDIEGHGTHVAGSAAAASNDVGVAGVAPQARIVAVRVFSESTDPVTGDKSYGASSSDINAGIRWVIANVAAKGSINLSLGGNFVVTTVDGAGFEVGIEEAWKAGWTPVLASGNENVLGVAGSSNYGSLNSLVVGATGPDDRLAGYSSPFGSAKWGLVAPGGNASSCQSQPERCILSTHLGGRYGYLQGTSMATPHVAGAVALLMGAGLTNAQAVQRILDSANKSVSCGSGCKGRLDVAKATQGLGGGSAPAASPAPAPGASPAPAPSAGSPSSPPPTSRRAPGPAPRPAPPSAVTPAPPPDPAASGTTEAPLTPSTDAEAPAETTSSVPETSEPSSEDAVVGLSVEEAAALGDEASGSDEPSAGLLAAAVLAAAGVAGWAGALVWRRRRAGSPG